MANIGGVQYAQTPQLPMQGAVSPIQGLGQGLQIGSALGGMVKQGIDKRRQKRSLDKFMVGLGDREPTRADFKKMAGIIGPEKTVEFLKMHDSLRQMEDAERKQNLDEFGMGIDAVGSALMQVMEAPPEQRMQVFTQLLTPLAQQEYLRDDLKPWLKMFEDGNFSDEKIQPVLALAATMGRYQEVHDNRLQARAKKEDSAADRKSREDIAAGDRTSREGIAAGNRQEQTRREIEKAKMGGKLTPQEVVALAMKYAQEYQGKPSHWAQFIRGKSLKIGEGVEGPQMLDLGSFNQGALDPNDVLAGGAPPAGSPTILRRLFESGRDAVSGLIK